MAKQKIVRVYPNEFSNPTRRLQEHLDKGWTVLMVNTVSSDKYTYNDYIITKEDED